MIQLSMPCRLGRLMVVAQVVGIGNGSMGMDG